MTEYMNTVAAALKDRTSDLSGAESDLSEVEILSGGTNDESESADLEKGQENGPDTSRESRCYTVKDLQKILGISRPSVYELLKRNEFNWFRLGGSGKYRISKKSFDDWLDKGRGF